MPKGALLKVWVPDGHPPNRLIEWTEGGRLVLTPPWFRRRSNARTLGIYRSEDSLYRLVGKRKMGIETAQEGINIQSDFRSDRRELSLTDKIGSDLLGEVEVWLPPTHLGTFEEAGLTDIEWIEVAPAYRRKGFGLALQAECIRVGRQHGGKAFMLWVEASAEESNVPMQKLAVKAGFSSGPVLHWIKYSSA